MTPVRALRPLVLFIAFAIGAIGTPAFAAERWIEEVMPNRFRFDSGLSQVSTEEHLAMRQALARRDYKSIHEFAYRRFMALGRFRDAAYLAVDLRMGPEFAIPALKQLRPASPLPALVLSEGPEVALLREKLELIAPLVSEYNIDLSYCYAKCATYSYDLAKLLSAAGIETKNVIREGHVSLLYEGVIIDPSFPQILKGAQGILVAKPADLEKHLLQNSEAYWTSAFVTGEGRDIPLPRPYIIDHWGLPGAVSQSRGDLLPNFMKPNIEVLTLPEDCHLRNTFRHLRAVAERSMRRP